MLLKCLDILDIKFYFFNKFNHIAFVYFSPATYHDGTAVHITPRSGISRLHSKHITSPRDISRHTVAYHVCTANISRRPATYHVCTANISRTARCIFPFPLDLLKRMRYNNGKSILTWRTRVCLPRYTPPEYSV